MFTGIHPDWPSNYCRHIVANIKTFEMKEQVVAVTVQRFEEKVFAVDGQIREDQAGALWRKVYYNRGDQTRKRYASAHIL